MPVLGDEREWRRDLEGREPAELLGGVDDEVSVEPDDVAGVHQLEEHGTAVDVLDRLQLELERGHDAEVTASATKGPEQIRVHVLGRHQEPTVRRHDVGRDQVVAGEAEAAREVADPAAERQAPDPGGGDDAARRGQPEGVRRGVQVSPRGAALCPGRPPRRIDADALHPGEVDDHPAVTRAEPRHAVRATADGQVDPTFASEVHRGDDVAGVHRAHDDRRPLVDHAVVDLAGLLVRPVVRGDDVPANLLAKLVDGRPGHSSPLPSWAVGLSYYRWPGECISGLPRWLGGGGASGRGPALRS